MPDHPSDDQRNAATFAALSLVLAVSVGLLALVAFVVPAVLWFVLVPMALGGMLVLHYVTWGRWLATTFEAEDNHNEQTKPPQSPN